MRNLTIENTGRIGGCKEFNHLRILNLQEFLDRYLYNLDYSASPWQVIANLEKEVLFENAPEECYLITCKGETDAVFQLIEIKEEGDLRIVVFVFDCFIS
jgi:hypothetical protein